MRVQSRTLGRTKKMEKHKWPDVLLRVLVAALLALAGALTEAKHPGALSGLVRLPGEALGAELLPHVRSELRSSSRVQIPSPVPMA